MRISLLASLALVFVCGGASAASAQTTRTASSTEAVRYPVSELGNCASKDDCRTYCGVASHVQACLIFGKTHDLLSTSDVQKAVLLQSMQGPGGCRGLQCINYCNVSSRASECAAFANRIVNVSKDIQAYEATTTSPRSIIMPAAPRPLPPQPFRRQPQKDASSSITSYLGAAVMSALFLLFPL